MSMDDTTDGSLPEMDEPRRGSRRAAVGLAGVMAFALLVAAVAVLAARGGGSKPLPVLPALSNASAEAAGAGMAAMAPAGPVTYQLEGNLPALADHAPAYRLSGPVTAAAVAKVAAALGLKGTPQPTSNQWTLQEGTRLLMVGTDPSGSWVYTADSHCVPMQTSVAGIACAATGYGVATPGTATAGPPTAGTAASPTAAGGSASSPTSPPAPTSVPTGTAPSCPMPPCTSGACPQFCVAPPVCTVERAGGGTCPGVTAPSRPADAPTVQEAEVVARGFLGRLGVDAANAAVTTVETATGWQVEVSPQVGGLPTQGYLWSVDVGPKGSIDGAGGKLAAPALIGSYPLVGVQAGFERLKAGNSSLNNGITPMIGAPAFACRAPTTTGGTASPAPVCEPRVVTITGAKLALGLAVSPSEAVLEPLYLFQTSTGGDVAVLATVDRLVAPPAAIARVEPPVTAVPAKPVPLPMPAPANSSPPAYGQGPQPTEPVQTVQPANP